MSLWLGDSRQRNGPYDPVVPFGFTDILGDFDREVGSSINAFMHVLRSEKSRLDFSSVE